MTHAVTAEPLPTPFLLKDSAYALDGGSIVVVVVGSDDADHYVEVPQHSLEANFTSDRIPGRLHFDGQPVPVRGEREEQVLAALEQARLGGSLLEAPPPSDTAAAPRLILSNDIRSYFEAIAESPAAAVRYLVTNLIAWVRSAEYLQVAQRAARED